MKGRRGGGGGEEVKEGVQGEQPTLARLSAASFLVGAVTACGLMKTNACNHR